MYVDCGHCTNCVSNSRNKWAQRLDLEGKGAASTLFFTLTYSNEHIPTLTYDITESWLTSNRNINDSLFVDDSHRHEINALIPLQTSKGDYIPYTCSYVCKSDFQKCSNPVRIVDKLHGGICMLTAVIVPIVYQILVISGHNALTLKVRVLRLLCFSR